MFDDIFPNTVHHFLSLPQSCDMWSLGVIIYIMLCGYPPFFPETPSKQMSKEMRQRIMGGQYEFPAPEWTHVSEEAKDVVSR